MQATNYLVAKAMAEANVAAELQVAGQNQQPSARWVECAGNLMLATERPTNTTFWANNQ
jgi:hypothetical protein